MPFARLKGLFELIAEEERREQLEEWKRTAFIGFQLKQFDKEISFQDYLEDLNLTEKAFGLPEIERKDRGYTTTDKDEAKAIAERVIAQLTE